MKGLVLKCIFLLLFAALWKVGSAYHVASELKYRHINAGVYEFTFTLYQVCDNPSTIPPFNIDLNVKSASRNISGVFGSRLVLLNKNAPNYPDIEPPNILNCIDNPPCIKEYVYRGIINLVNTSFPSSNYQSADWVFYVDYCCVPFTNKYYSFNNRTLGGSRVECGLNNLDFPKGNNSPFWNDRVPNFPGQLTDTTINIPVIGVCANRNITLDQSAKDYDGDILSYSFSSLPTSSYPFTYSFGYSFTYPLPFLTPPGFSIDSNSGQINFIPLEDTLVSGAAYYSIYVRVDEYRYDTVLLGGVITPRKLKIGYSIRNLNIVIESDSTCTDKDLRIKNKTVKINCNQTIIELETSDNFFCNSIDRDGSFTVLKERVTGINYQIDSVLANNCYRGKISNEIKVYLTTPLPSGEYFITIQKGGDGNTFISECGLEAPELVDTVLIQVDTVKPSSISTYLDPNNDKYMQLNCGQEEFWTKWNSPVLCSSIDSLGTEFILINTSTQPPAILPIDAIIPLNCTGGITDSVLFKLSQPFESGYYELQLKEGDDGNTVLNSCNEETAAENIRIEIPTISIDLGPDLTYCKDSFFYKIIGTNGVFSTYTWNNGRKTNLIEIFTEGSYILQVNNGYGCKARDTVVVTEIDCGTGIEAFNISSFDVFPVPADNTLKVINKGNNPIRAISILDQSGREVMIAKKSTHEQNNELNTSELPNGNYFIKVEFSDHSTEVQKIVIIH